MQEIEETQAKGNTKRPRRQRIRVVAEGREVQKETIGKRPVCVARDISYALVVLCPC